MNKLIIAKALRSSFCATKNDLLKMSYMDDEYLIKKLREAQEEMAEFSKIVDDLKVNDKESYEKLLGA